jgi:hypothetical protein
LNWGSERLLQVIDWAVRMAFEMQRADGLRVATMRGFEQRRWLRRAKGPEDDFKLYQILPAGEI